MLTPDYIFETSWEVCNKVGGIYAVLSTRAATMVKEHPDKVIFFGPDFGAHSDKFFRQDKSLLSKWQRSLRSAHPDIDVRVGRWLVPGEPIAVLIKFDRLWEKKNNIFGWAWEHFGVQSHAAYGDYDESCLFGYAAGEAMCSLAAALREQEPKCRIVAHSNEWQTAFSIFYVRHYCPFIGTLFTTHATSIGRSIAGNGKPLYDYFEGYHGDQMAEELNMVSKHSVEKMAAHWADCFTTVSDITAAECKQLLDKPVDIVTPNGFEPDFVPKGKAFDSKRNAARKALMEAAQNMGFQPVKKDAFFVCIAGRLETKNKGIDVFHYAMESLGNKLYHSDSIDREVIAFIMVPYLDNPVMRIGNVTAIFVPYYLDGKSAMPDKRLASLNGFTYYDLLIGMDVTAFPSYYEPWGYTPLESVAFHVPTITTSLAGFGVWAQQEGSSHIEQGVEVVERSDSNFWSVVDKIADAICRFITLTPEQTAAARKAAADIAKRAEWRYFFKYYRQAYNIALTKSQERE